MPCQEQAGKARAPRAGEGCDHVRPGGLGCEKSWSHLGLGRVSEPRSSDLISAFGRWATHEPWM